MFISLNNISFKLSKDYTIFQFCSIIGLSLPCFCYHEKLSIAGNCRICLVESNSKLVASCAMPFIDGMIVYTDNKKVVYSREGVVEFLLVNHPLDCPICDQGGECDLQDITITYGNDRGRFYEFQKKAVNDINFSSPLIKTIMTRCIHCTRCVRFINEICGSFDFGVIGRGFNMEIGTYLNIHLDNELIGNVIDLCPVGALTSMPYAFSNRPWELASVFSVDFLDSLASSIRVDTCNNKIVRVLPFLNENINEEWLSNKARFYYDALLLQRFNYPKFKFNGKLVILGLFRIFFIFFKIFIFKVKNLNNISVYTSYFNSIEENFLLKDFFNSLGCSNIYFFKDQNLNVDWRLNYLVNKISFNIFPYNYFFLGSNLRFDSPILNLKFRKDYLKGTYFFRKFYSLGGSLNYSTFPIENIGNSSLSLKFFLEAKFFYSRNFLINNFYNKFMFILNKININIKYTLNTYFFFLLTKKNYNNGIFLKLIFLKVKIFLSKLIYFSLSNNAKNTFLNLSFFIGESVLNRIDSNNILASLTSFVLSNKNDKALASYYLNKNNNLNLSNNFFNKTSLGARLNIISNFLGKISSMENGINNINLYNSNINNTLLFLTDVDKLPKLLGKNNFIVFFGSLKNTINYLNKIDIIIPVTLPVENNLRFLNLEGFTRINEIILKPKNSIFSISSLFKILIILNKLFLPSRFSFLRDFTAIKTYFSNIVNYYIYCFFTNNKKFTNIVLFYCSFLNFSSTSVHCGIWKWFYKKQSTCKFNVRKYYTFRIINSIFLQYTTNYYNTEFLSKNSKILSLSALKVFNSNFSQFINYE